MSFELEGRVTLWARAQVVPWSIEPNAIDPFVKSLIALVQREVAAAEKFCAEGHSIHAPGPAKEMPCPTCIAVRAAIDTVITTTETWAGQAMPPELKAAIRTEEPRDG